MMMMIIIISFVNELGGVSCICLCFGVGWRRRCLELEVLIIIIFFFMWEELVVECRVLRNNVSLQVNNGDHRRWNLDPTVGNSVSESYQLLAQSVSHGHTHVSDFLWHKDIALKVFAFAWRLLKNWLCSFYKGQIIYVWHP